MVHSTSWLLALGAIVFFFFRSSNALLCEIDNEDCVDCMVSSWSGWSSCSGTCGSGLKTRRRTIYFGSELSCPYHLKEAKTCTTNL